MKALLMMAALALAMPIAHAKTQATAIKNYAAGQDPQMNPSAKAGDSSCPLINSPSVAIDTPPAKVKSAELKPNVPVQVAQ